MIIGQFLVLKKIEDLFRESLKDTCGASAKQAPYFYCRNYQVVPWFYIPRIMLILHGPFFLDILASISSLFLSRSFFFLHICCCDLCYDPGSAFHLTLSLSLLRVRFQQKAQDPPSHQGKHFKVCISHSAAPQPRALCEARRNRESAISKSDSCRAQIILDL